MASQLDIEITTSKGLLYLTTLCKRALDAGIGPGESF